MSSLRAFEDEPHEYDVSFGMTFEAKDDIQAQEFVSRLRHALEDMIQRGRFAPIYLDSNVRVETWEMST